MTKLFKRVLSPSIHFEPTSLYNKINKEQMSFFDNAYKNQLKESAPKTMIVHPDTNFLYLRCVVPDKEMTPEAQKILDKCCGCSHLQNDPSIRWSLTWPFVCKWSSINPNRSPRAKCLKHFN